MRLCFIAIVAGVITACDGRLATTKSPAPTPPQGPSRRSGHSNNGNKDKAPTPAAGTETPRRFSPCSHPCFTFTIKKENYPYYEERCIDGGKWLKIRTKPFDYRLPNEEQFVDLNGIFKDESTFAVPALMKIEFLPGRTKNYFTAVSSLMQRLHGEAAKYRQDLKTPSLATNRLLEMQRQFRSLKSTVRTGVQTAFTDHLKDSKMTLYNYIHPQYQADPNSMNVTNENITVVNVPYNCVYVKAYPDNTPYGVSRAPAVALRLAQLVNQTDLNTYYIASYANTLYEVWVDMDQTKTPYP